jgi:hypothetical protein
MNSKIVYLLLAVLLILSAYFIYGYYSYKATVNNFKQNGIQTTATIVEVIQKRTRDRRYSLKVRYKRRHYIKVTYFTRSKESNDSTVNKKTVYRDEKGKLKMDFSKNLPKIGEFVSTIIGIKSDQYKQFKKGDKIEILYLPNDIENAIIKQDIE